MWYLLFELIFVSILALVSTQNDFAIPDTKTLVLFVLASFRIARTLSFNEIGAPIRAPFTECVQDSCGAGMSLQPRGSGLRYAIGSLLICPICTGTWASLALYVIWTLAPSFGVALLWVLGVAGGAELVHWFAEHQEWAGRAQRCLSGLISPDKSL